MDKVWLNNLDKGLKTAPAGEQFTVFKKDITEASLESLKASYSITVDQAPDILYYIITKV